MITFNRETGDYSVGFGITKQNQNQNRNQNSLSKTNRTLFS